MADNQRAKHGQPSQPGGQGNQKSHEQGKEEGNQASRFGQGGKGDQKQENPGDHKGKQGQGKNG